MAKYFVIQLNKRTSTLFVYFNNCFVLSFFYLEHKITLKHLEVGCWGLQVYIHSQIVMLQNEILVDA